MTWLSSESALAWCAAVFCVSMVARAFLHAAHRAAQPFGVEYGFFVLVQYVSGGGAQREDLSLRTFAAFDAFLRGRSRLFIRGGETKD